MELKDNVKLSKMSNLPSSERLQKETINEICKELSETPHELVDNVLPDEIFASIFNSLEKVILNPEYSIKSFKTNKERYNSEETVIIGMASLIKSLNTSLEEAKTELEVYKDELNQKEKEIEEINERFQKTFDELKEFQEKNNSLQDKRQVSNQLKDANERISLMQNILKTTKEEKEELKTQLDSEMLHSAQMEEEMQKIRSELDKSNSAVTALNEISQALGYQSAETSEEVIMQFRDLLEAPNEVDSIEEIVDRLKKSNTQYISLLRSFGLNLNTQDKENAIRKICEENAVYRFKLDHSIQSTANNVDELYDELTKEKEYNFTIEDFKCFSLEPKITETRNQTTQTSKLETDVDDNTSILAFQSRLAESYRQQNEELRNDLKEATETATSLKNTEKKFKSFRTQNQKLESEVNKLKEQLESEQMKNEENEVLVSKQREECEELQSQVEELTHINTTLKETIAIREEEKIDNNSSKRINDAFALALNEIQEQSDELSRMAMKKTECVNLIDKQLKLIEAYDIQLQFAQIDKEKPAEREIIEKEFNDDNLFDLITSIDSIDSYEQIEEITNIARGRGKAINKLKKIIEWLLKEINKAKKEDGPNVERLYNLLNSQLLYIEAIVEDEQIPKTIKNQLCDSSKDAQKFLKKFAPGLVEEFSLYNLLDTDEDPETLSESLEALFDSYPELETEKSNEIFITLRQAIAVISLLRKFCSTAQLQCKQLHSENAQLKEDLNIMKTEIEEEKAQIDQAYEEKENLEKALSAVHVAVSTRDIDQNLATEIEDLCNGNTMPEDYSIQRIRELESTLNQTSIQLDELHSEEIEKSNKVIEEQKSLIQKKEDDIKGLEKEIKTLQKEKKKQKEASHNLKKELSALEKKNGNLKQKLESEKREKDVLSVQYAQQKGSLQAQISSLSEDIKRRDENVDEDKEENERIKNKLKKYKTKCNELEHTVSITKKQIQSLRDENTKMSADLIRAKSKIRQLKEDISALEIENNVVKAKVGLVENRYEQQIKQFKDAQSVENAAKEATFRSEKSKYIQENEKRKSAFFFELTSLLRSKIDITKQLNENVALEVIKSMVKSENAAIEENERLKDLERQNKTIRSLLNAKESDRTITLVQSLVESK